MATKRIEREQLVCYITKLRKVFRAEHGFKWMRTDPNFTNFQNSFNECFVLKLFSVLMSTYPNDYVDQKIMNVSKI